MESPQYANSRWGLMTYDFKTGKQELVMNERQFFIPASTTKLFSMSAAWNTFGPDHRFTTPVYRQGSVAGGNLTGNLVLVASGDLTMGGRTKPDGTVDFTNLDHADANAIPGATLTPENPLAGIDMIAKQVKDSGVTHVSGDVVIDDRLFTIDTAAEPGDPDLADHHQRQPHRHGVDADRRRAAGDARLPTAQLGLHGHVEGHHGRRPASRPESSRNRWPPARSS